MGFALPLVTDCARFSKGLRDKNLKICGVGRDVVTIGRALCFLLGHIPRLTRGLRPQLWGLVNWGIEVGLGPSRFLESGRVWGLRARLENHLDFTGSGDHRRDDLITLDIAHPNRLIDIAFLQGNA